MPVPSARENRQETQNFVILQMLGFFDHSGHFQEACSVFHFTIFIDFDSLILEIWKIHRPDLIHRVNYN